MTRDATTTTPLGAPIPANWTMTALLARLSDDQMLDDRDLLLPLAALEAAVTGSTWTRPPAVVALVRSLAAAVAAEPALRDRTVAELLANADHVGSASAPHLATRSVSVGAARRERQVA